MTKRLTVMGKGCLSLEFLFVLLYGVSWVWNLVKFLQCDFLAPWKLEIVHGIGVFVPTASLITVWF